MAQQDFSSFEGFSATINGISIFDYLQLLILTNKRKLVEFKTGDKLGYIAVDSGKIVFSKVLIKDEEKLDGLDAFLNIMTWKNGTFKDMKIQGNIRRNINDERNLLLVAAETIDKEQLKNSN